MKKYRLKDSNFVDPRWYNEISGKPHNCRVSDDCVSVHLDGEILTLPEPLAPGAELVVEMTLGFIFGYPVDEYMRKAAEDARLAKEVEQKEKAREARERERSRQYRIEAEVYNAKINLPVEWAPGQKDVLSGLGEYGDGRNSRSVNHVWLREDLNVGRFRRVADDFLCGGSKGKLWSGVVLAEGIDDKGSYPAQITCKKCIEILKRKDWIHEN